MTTPDWHPSTNRTGLEARAALLRQVRDFFFQRGVLEVETPLMGTCAGTDPNLEPFRLQPAGRADNGRYLQTSPEYAMKRLLAAGSGPIYQICKAFRQDEAGARHNPEFTMLEWYRPGFAMTALMDEVEALVKAVTGVSHVSRITYAELFRQQLDIDPHRAATGTLESLARSRLDLDFPVDSRDQWLDLLFSHCIEPALIEAVFITHWPATQAALAQLAGEGDEAVALRFELVVAGMELANGYQELTDPVEQRARFERDLAIRRRQGLPAVPVDERLLAALESGMPAGSGVALGVDRLLMLKTGTNDIRDILGFPFDRV